MLWAILMILSMSISHRALTKILLVCPYIWRFRWCRWLDRLTLLCRVLTKIRLGRPLIYLTLRARLKILRWFWNSTFFRRLVLSEYWDSLLASMRENDHDSSAAQAEFSWFMLYQNKMCCDCYEICCHVCYMRNVVIFILFQEKKFIICSTGKKNHDFHEYCHGSCQLWREGKADQEVYGTWGLRSFVCKQACIRFSSEHISFDFSNTDSPILSPAGIVSSYAW